MGRLRGFVIFAEMRTGSNYLEALLATCPGIRCHGEAFNPAFIGAPGQRSLFGLDLAAREDDPEKLLRRMGRRSDGLAGFRFFHDHDPRILEPVLHDPRWAKVLLSRDPAESYVSLGIARATDQWRLTRPDGRRLVRVTFDEAEFDALIAARAQFRAKVERQLQVSGQAAFRLDYRDLSDRAVVAGLARFLGCAEGPDWDRVPMLRQNPEPLRDKVVNPEVLAAARRRATEFEVARTA